MFTIEYGIGELPYPIAQYHQACFLAQHQVELYVAMTEYKIVAIGVMLHVLLGIFYQVFLVLAEIRHLLTILSLQSAVFGPVESQCHSPAWMYGVEQNLTGAVVEHLAQQLELMVWVAQTVTMSKEEDLAVDLSCSSPAV